VGSNPTPAAGLTKPAETRFRLACKSEDSPKGGRIQRNSSHSSTARAEMPMATMMIETR
jgi:hypothetical protein